MKVYIAGPYTAATSEERLENVNRAIDTAMRVASTGHVPYVPHLTHYMDERHPQSKDYWMKHDKVFLRSCHAVFRMPGDSEGADQEVAYAKSAGMPVYHAIEDLP